jgi:hypothetical protein
MNETEKSLEVFKNDLRALVERFEKENGMLLVDVKYDGFDKSVKYTITDGNAKFIRLIPNNSKENGRDEEM